MTVQAISPRVSVLMTIYNAAPFLRKSIDSLVAQQCHDWELIAVENGSTDASPSILAEYSDPRIRMFSLPANIGRTPALRYALDQARADYVAVLDADDVSHPTRLARQAEFLDRHPEVGLVGSWAQYIDDRDNVFAEFSPPIDPGKLRDCLGWINPIVHSSATYRRQLALEVGGYPEDLVWAQDLGLVLAVAQRTKIAVIDEFLCQLRLLTTGMTSSRNHRIIVAREKMMLLKRAADSLPFDESARRLNRRAQAIAEVRLGAAIFRSESILDGLWTMLKGLACDPSAVWRNGQFRRVFGRRADAWWFRNPHGKR